MVVVSWRSPIYGIGNLDELVGGPAARLGLDPGSYIDIVMARSLSPTGTDVEIAINVTVVLIDVRGRH